MPLILCRVKIQHGSGGRGGGIIKDIGRTVPAIPGISKKKRKDKLDPSSCLVAQYSRIRERMKVSLVRTGYWMSDLYC